MRTELWNEFAWMVSSTPRLLATVTAHNVDGTSSLTTYGGAQMRALGVLGGTIPYKGWIRGGRVLEVAPNLPLLEIVV